MTDVVVQPGTPKNLTATGTICTGPCTLIGFYVNSTSSGTIIFNDNTTPLGGAITPSVGFNAYPAVFQTSAKVTIGGTLDVTFFVVAGVN